MFGGDESPEITESLWVMVTKAQDPLRGRVLKLLSYGLNFQILFFIFILFSLQVLQDSSTLTFLLGCCSGDGDICHTCV